MFSSGLLKPYYSQHIHMYLNNTYTLLHKCYNNSLTELTVYGTDV